MIDNTSLSTKLAALVAADAVFVDGGARVISSGGAPLPMSAILREVDNTVLERTLTFTMGDVTVSLVAAGRRFRGITAITGDVPDKDDVVGQFLSAEDPDTINTVGAALTAISTAAAKITVLAAPVKSSSPSADTGVPATALAVTWGVDLDAAPPPPVERFLAANAGVMGGLLYLVDDKLVEAEGDSEVLQAIWDEQIVAFRTAHAKVRPDQDGPVLICLENALAGEGAVALVSAKNETGLFSYDTAAIGTLLASWAAITG
ncbi:hypothetical protein [Yoonia sp. SS1-5]|uniref:Uncharacterized protein n=1 Tax=Yoonia rhodophyticola TaxID=3137370 RepID=A0AAN0MBC8_9RHOB